ncbi:hypothetical protein QTQ03_26575 [Micromonospora sp. WMMA1363]|uniref:hypothetical protein n=1 Tax=Micromonospora sp. WMMA1363 TaxID=3053985 RepID=UPI00259CB074|nr:hypothetical protein [Micromonospora sp. WMMA1363]MDM4720134.1 hypothetical protein [Micromonospora sp. WMMA1363]MDM4722994.1 hypothetical protein [Micromonospora sp. WMMA1363]
MTAAGYVLLIVAGGPPAMLVPLLVARRLVEQHADGTATAIRRATPAADHPTSGMELVR